MCSEGGAAPPACTKVAAFLGEGAGAEAVAAALTMLFDIVKMWAQVADELHLSTTACACLRQHVVTGDSGGAAGEGRCRGCVVDGGAAV